MESTAGGVFSSSCFDCSNDYPRETFPCKYLTKGTITIVMRMGLLGGGGVCLHKTYPALCLKK